jgi:hypothetical protein
MTEQWEVMWRCTDGPSPGAPTKIQEGWEPFAATKTGIWLRRRLTAEMLAKRHHDAQNDPARQASARQGYYPDQRALTEEEQREITLRGMAWR